MSGRASRARLLAPSFLVVASAIACGQTSGGPDDQGGQGSSPTVGTSGDAGVGATGAGGTGIVGTGATGSTGVTGGYAGSCGGSCNPPAPSCPPTPPQQGAACFGSLMCQYGAGDAPIGCAPPSTYATCGGGTWNVLITVTSCNPPPVLTCPPTLPTPGSPCGGINPAGIMCAYPGRTCAREDASCPQGTWKVSACPTGVGGEGGVPSFGGEPAVGGAGGQGGAP